MTIDLKYLNDQGLIPGPDESEESFRARTAYCLKLKEHLTEMMPSEAAFTSEDFEMTAPILQEALPITKKDYDIAPNWVPLFFSNHALPPWHGGVAWIFQKDDQTPTTAFLQIRAKWLKGDGHLYKRQEIIAHELAHVGRMMFNEPKYEELIAYHSSKSSFRKLFGPLVQTSKEALLFVWVLLLVSAIDVITLTVLHDPNLYARLFWVKAFPVALVAYALWRLFRKRNTFKKTLKSLGKISPQPNAVIYRLTDHEIDLFSTQSPDQIRAYANANTTFRWSLIRELYFPLSSW